PRTDPYVRLSRIRLLPRMSDGKSLFCGLTYARQHLWNGFPALRPTRVLLVCIPLVSPLGSTGSAADRSALFASFAATTAVLDFGVRSSSAFGSPFPMRTRTELPWPNAGSPKFQRDSLCT